LILQLRGKDLNLRPLGYENNSPKVPRVLSMNLKAGEYCKRTFEDAQDAFLLPKCYPRDPKLYAGDEHSGAKILSQCPATSSTNTGTAGCRAHRVSNSPPSGAAHGVLQALQ